MKRSAIFLLILASLLVANQVRATSGYDCLFPISDSLADGSPLSYLNLNTGNYQKAAGLEVLYSNLAQAMSPDGKYLVYSKSDGIVRADEQIKVTLMLRAIVGTSGAYLLADKNPKAIGSSILLNSAYRSDPLTAYLEVSWSPDSQWFVYRWYNEQDQQQYIAVVDTHGKTLQLRSLGIGPSNFYAGFSGWSKDGLHLALYIDGKLIFWKIPELTPVDTDISRPVGSQGCFIPYEGDAYCAYWSPDGSYAGFVRTESDGQKRLVFMSPGQRAKTVTFPLVNKDANTYSIQWSPDGKYAVVVAGDGDNRSPASLDMVGTDGKRYVINDQTMFRHFSDNDRGIPQADVSWSLDGKSAVYPSFAADSHSVLTRYFFDTQTSQMIEPDAVQKLSYGSFFLDSWQQDGKQYLGVLNGGTKIPLTQDVSPSNIITYNGFVYIVWDQGFVWAKLDGSDRHQIALNAPLTYDYPTPENLSNDGHWVLLTTGKDTVIVNILTGEQHLTNLIVKNMSISPGNKYILLSSGDKLYLFTWGSDQLREIEPNVPKRIDKLSWSPDSSAFSFVNTIDTNYTLEVVSAAGDSVRHFDNFPAVDQFAWTQCALLN